MRKEIFAIAIVGVLLLVFGCVSNTNQGNPNETKLEVTQGIGILKDQIKVDDLFPGTEGFISFTVRDNLGGVTAKDIIVGLGNLGLFRIIECGGSHNSSELRSCPGIWDLDSKLPYGERGTKFMIPGTEKQLWWRIKAPDENSIGDITLSYPIYYHTEYTYWTTNAQTVAFMSQNELIRRKEANENTEISGKEKLSAGEIYVEFATPQPIVYFYSPGNNQPPYNFTVVYKVKNQGGGYAISDVLLALDLPNGINYTDLSDYDWKLAKSPDCHLYFFNSTSLGFNEMRCDDALRQALGSDYHSIKSDVDNGRVIVKVISRKDLSSQPYTVPCELQITSKMMNDMYNSNVPMKFFTFQTFVIYRYYKEGKININVYPVRV